MGIVQMSLQGGAVILGVWLIRALGRDKLPAWSFEMMWAVAFTRLVLPVRIESPTSAYAAFGGAWINAPQPAPAGAHAALTSGAGAALPQGPSPWLILWLIGAALLLAYFVCTHIRCHKKYRLAQTVARVHVSPRGWSRCVAIRASRQVDAPLTYGVLRPVILVPEGLVGKGEPRNYVLAHELAHVRRFDVLKKWLLCLCLCAHWLNPLVWAMYVMAGRDMELCCDRAVLRQFGAHQKVRYARLLIDMEEARTAPMPLSGQFNRTGIEERIEAIMKFKKGSWARVVVALALVLVTASALATNVVTEGVAEQAPVAQGGPGASLNEYARQAWKMDYAQLTANVNVWKGRVFLLDGTVTEVLAGEEHVFIMDVKASGEGEGQYVIVVNEALDALPQVGARYKAYADVAGSGLYDGQTCPQMVCRYLIVA